MRLLKEKSNIEGGQALILFTLMLCALLLCAMAVVDVGFFLHNRENAQQTADAAALAGAQDLPGSTTQAQTDALAYVTKNGLSTTNTVISFTCTSQVQAICMPGDGRYDTIIVTQKAPSPTYFGGVLSILGFNSCWVQGCTASATAGACRGACGPIGTGPADIMTVMDHSNSMSDANIQNAKDAISSMFGNFNYTYQRVGLAVTPPVTPANNCDAIDHWTDTKVWMPGPLTSTFQTAPHVLNNSSPPVHVASCIDRTTWSPPGELTDYPMLLGNGQPCSCHTDVGSPLQAAKNELAANGRANVVHGIILVTDGAANVAPTTTTVNVIPNNTGFVDCTSNAAVTSNAGDNNGFESSGTGSDLCDGNNNDYAVDGTSSNGSGTTTTIVCPDTTSSGGSGASGKDKHVVYNYGLNVPSNATITGISVRVDGMINQTTSTTTKMFCIQLSQDNGATWTTAQSQSITGTTETTYPFGSSSDLWGKTWTPTQTDNSHFRVRITDVSNVTARIFSIDDVQVKVNYTTTSSVTTFTASRGPCDWASQQATAAKTLGIEVFVIGFGVPTNEQCNDYGELSTSPWYNTYAPAFLQSLATDASHYYNQPKTSDLTVIFNSIGSQLTSGSKLIQ